MKNNDKDLKMPMTSKELVKSAIHFKKPDRLAVMNLMKRKLLNMKDLITGLYPFSKAPGCYEMLKNPSQPGTLTFVLQWN